MASMNMVEQLEEQPPAKKPRIDKTEERGEIANSNESNLSKSTERNDEDSGTSTKIMDLASSRRPLPLELNCEIFKCLKLPIQKKFIWGLGRDIYGMFGQKLLIKTKRVRNPKKNVWDRTRSRRVNTTTTGTYSGPTLVYAMKGFPISRELSRKDNFPGTILYYFEVTESSMIPCFSTVHLGLSDKSVPNGSPIFAGWNYYIDYGMSCFVAGKEYQFDFLGFMRRNVAYCTTVHGCGLLMEPNDKLSIFFTLNGKLKGTPIPIRPSVDCLFPSARISNCIIEANFGDDPEGEPFAYDIENCPGLGLACI